MLRLLLLLLSLPTLARAHPINATLGEAHWRGDRLEVALRVPTHDLVAALSRRRVDVFAATGEAGVQRYVAEFFEVHAPTGKQPLRWVGLDVQPEEAWLYFEVPLPGLAGMTLSHRLFFDQAPAQLNTFIMIDGSRQWGLVFSRERPTLPLLLPHGDGTPRSPAAKP